MSKKLKDIPRDRLGYYGLRRILMLRQDEKPLPSWIWKLYWFFQPLRCKLTYHDWYSVLAGEASACLCGAFGPYHSHIMHQYHWQPWLRKYVARAEDAEFRFRAMTEFHNESRAENADLREKLAKCEQNVNWWRTKDA